METTSVKRAPILNAIVALKLGKGLCLLLLASVLLNLSLDELHALTHRLFAWLHLEPSFSPATDLLARLERLTEGDVRLAAATACFFGLIAMVEGIGLSQRVSWAGWMAICRSSVFIPFVVHRLLLVDFNPLLLMVLAANSFIVWYLVQNRVRLFSRSESNYHSSTVGQPSEDLPLTGR